MMENAKRLAFSKITLTFESAITWDLGILVDETFDWLNGIKISDTSKVGILSSPKFTDLIKSAAPQLAQTNFQLMMYAISLAYSRPAKHVLSIADIHKIGCIAGHELLKALEQCMRPQSLNHCSANDLRALFLMVFGTVLAFMLEAASSRWHKQGMFDWRASSPNDTHLVPAQTAISYRCPSVKAQSGADSERNIPMLEVQFSLKTTEVADPLVNSSHVLQLSETKTADSDAQTHSYNPFNGQSQAHDLGATNGENVPALWISQRATPGKAIQSVEESTSDISSTLPLALEQYASTPISLERDENLQVFDSDLEEKDEVEEDPCSSLHRSMWFRNVSATQFPGHECNQVSRYRTFSATLVVRTLAEYHHAMSV
ncbi:uncharacterized protein LY89DRAFT_736319 [Mollisia scopiformis]|uniref:Uncharacterized protein n=1 Tax=Mollisia scopiformis TaxID=149040 RepID=A0A194X2N0_MOLSC|nr:uncharacterized protein LY89DRAFT_736319 [Mollisia scopiformis]KUJ14274.1 hypothetical protein LY89DRAFT_736319 [Mollisia scopiformis]